MQPVKSNCAHAYNLPRTVNKEVAHFPGNNELDIRLSKETIKQEGLTHAPNRIGHLNRKNSGRWLIARFTRESHLAQMERLIKMAIKLR